MYKISAEVVWWETKHIIILCPYCEQLHQYSCEPSDFPHLYKKKNHFVAPRCEIDGASRYPHYRFRWPAAIRIDKALFRFYNVRLAGRQNDRIVPQDGDLTDSFATMYLSDTPTAPVPPEAPDIDMSWDECALKQVDKICYSLISPAARDFVLSWRHGQSGDTVLHYAAVGGHLWLVKLLCEAGAKIHHRNAHHRTPLMEAALWGRLEVVQYLLEKGARPSDRDKHRGAFVADFADNYDLRNAHERAERAPSFRQSLAEARKADADRCAIRAILETSEGAKQSRPSSPSLFSHTQFLRFRYQQTSKTVLMSAFQEWPESSTKTIALLERGEHYPHVCAKSGWHYSSSSEPAPLISGWLYYEKVMALVKNFQNFYGKEDFSYVLPADKDNDQGILGRHAACHAEKQLVAYFLDNHVFLPWETSYAVDFGESSSELRALEAIKPENLLKNATIGVSRGVCDDCRTFTVALQNKIPGLSFKILEC